jgi:transcriptional regulator of heat shock response
MEDLDTAKFIISTLLGLPVVSISSKQQELTYTPEETENIKSVPPVRLMRLDFVAVILTETGEHHKALIEMQKSLEKIDVMRFRNYLAEEYKRYDTVDGKDELLPVIPIYILGDNLPKTQTACFRVIRGDYYDAVHKKNINEQEDFVNLLSHDMVVVQTRKIESNLYEDKLDKLLSVFEQQYFIDDKKIFKDYKHVIDDENIRRIIDILHYCASNVEERKQIEAEHEAWRVYYALVKDEREKITEKDVVIAEKDAVIAEKEELLARERALRAKLNALTNSNQ